MKSSRWGLVLLLLLASPAGAGSPVRCQTYPEPTMGRLQTLCSDGTRAVSTWNKTLSRWESTVTSPPSSNRWKIQPRRKENRP